MRIRHLELPAPDAILGSKGMAEGGTVAAAAALANAVSDAIGAEFNALPLTPERLWHAAKAKSGEASGSDEQPPTVTSRGQ